MEDIYKIKTVARDYNIHFSAGFDKVGEIVSEFDIKTACIVTDDIVADLYLSKLREKLPKNIECAEIIFKNGENSKTLSTIESFYHKFAKCGLDRGSLVVALGGGVCGDMAGFAAATYMRGVRFAQIPTTLLAQVDASVGGKTGVNLGVAKNLIGAFWQPCFVLINVETLKTLSEEQFNSGIAEALKHGLIRDKIYFDEICENATLVKQRDTNFMSKLVKRSVQIKAKIVENDEREKGERELLNFGHTFGHAIESLLDFSLSHGHCVAIGMVAAAHASNLPQDYICRIKTEFEKFGLPVSCSIENGQSVLEYMRRDKKSRNGEINLVLLEEIGNAYRKLKADRATVMKGIESILCK